ncbi:MAG: SMI1/KNR4 family protein [Myxococcales bacterium]|nr:SMI1/KNR4 family protein [Myxococcales bacterium]MCB9714272.1 SMI1/KNR4 family protein [Myxococcales bacterium]
MTEEQLRELLHRLVEATFARDQYYEEDAARPELSQPATPEQISALERHWGRRLPPSYRKLLGICNGMTKFLLDVALLSTQELIDDVPGLETFEEPFPDLWKWIFACAGDSYDALAFDPSQTRDDGEMAVVLIGDEGEAGRWPSLEDFLQSLVARVEAELASERADRENLPE